MYSKIRTAYVMVQFVVTVLITIIFMYLFRKHNRKVRKNWAKLQKYLSNYTISIQGELDKEADIIIVNHQSLLDIVVLEELHPKDLCWVAKKEIEKIPFFGHIIKAPSMISVVREDKRSLIKLVKDVKDRLEKGRIIAIFPEGTRGDGEKLLPFQKGSKFLIEKLNLKVMPVVVSGSRKVLNSQNFTSQSGHIKIKYLKSFTPEAKSSWYEDLQVNMQKEIDELANNSIDR